LGYFPYDASLGDGQPEMLARIVRCVEVLEVVRATYAREKVQSENAKAAERSAKLDQITRALGIVMLPQRLPLPYSSRSTPTGNGTACGSQRTRKARQPEARSRRAGSRAPGADSVVEEAMTIDFSAKSMRFRSHREYAVGERVEKSGSRIPLANRGPGNGEFSSKVVRVAPATDTFALDVSVCRSELNFLSANSFGHFSSMSYTPNSFKARLMSSSHDSRNFFLEGPAGRLEAILWTPLGGARPPLAAVVCHPHPLWRHDAQQSRLSNGEVA